MVRNQGLDGAVVESHWLFPRDQSSTHREVIFDGNVERYRGEKWKFFVCNRNSETMNGNISIDVCSRDDDFRNSERESITTEMSTFDQLDFTIISCRCFCPLDYNVAKTRFTQQLDICRSSDELREFQINDGHVETCNQDIFIHIHCGVSHRGNSWAHETARRDIRGQRFDPTIIHCKRKIPRYNCTTDSWFGNHGIVRRQTDNGRNLNVCHGDQEFDLTHISRCIRSNK